MTYQPLVYRTSGGDQLNVTASGNLNIAAGGQITGGGRSMLTTGGYWADPLLFFEQATGQGGVLTNYGLSVIATSDPGAGNLEFTVAPAAGRVKYITCLDSTATLARVAVTTGTWDGTNKNLIFSTGAANPQSVLAIGASTTRWYLIPLSTDYTLSNT